MARVRHHADRLSSPVALLLIAVMLLRGLVPTGFMPERNALTGGGFELVICHAGTDGPSTYMVLPQGSDETPAAPAKSSGCDFALLAVAYVATKVADLAAPDRIAIILRARLGDATGDEQGTTRGGWARAPPAMS